MVSTTIIAKGELKDGSAYEGKFAYVSTTIIARGGLTVPLYN